MSRKTTMIAAIREAIDEEMLRDENVIVLGEDIGELGGPFGSCIGLLQVRSRPHYRHPYQRMGLHRHRRGRGHARQAPHHRADVQ